MRVPHTGQEMRNLATFFRFFFRRAGLDDSVDSAFEPTMRPGAAASGPALDDSEVEPLASGKPTIAGPGGFGGGDSGGFDLPAAGGAGEAGAAGEVRLLDAGAEGGGSGAGGAVGSASVGCVEAVGEVAGVVAESQKSESKSSSKETGAEPDDGADSPAFDGEVISALHLGQRNDCPP